MKRVGMYVCAALMSILASRTGNALDYTKAEVDVRITASAEYPVFGNRQVDDDLQRYLEEQLNKGVAGWSGVGVHPDYPEGGVEIAVSNEVESVRERFVNVILQTYVNPFGAAHPLTAIDIVRYDMVEGKRLELDDLFRDPDAALQAMAEIAPSVLEKDLVAVQAELGYIPWFKEGFTPERENYATLAVRPDGVVVVFQQYQVLPYVYGFQKAFIPIDVLRQAGPNPTIWPLE